MVSFAVGHSTLRCSVAVDLLLSLISPHVAHGVRGYDMFEDLEEEFFPAGITASEWEKEHCTRKTLTSPLVCKCEGVVFIKYIKNLRLDMNATLEGALVNATQDIGNFEEAFKDMSVGLLAAKKDINPGTVMVYTWNAVQYSLEVAAQVLMHVYPGVTASTIQVAASGMGGLQTMLIGTILQKFVELERETTQYAYQASRVAIAMFHKAECISGHLSPQLKGFEKGTLRLSTLATNICESSSAQEKLKVNIKHALEGIASALETMREIGECLYPLGNRVAEKGLCVEVMYGDFSLGGKRGLGVLFVFTNLLVLHTSLMDELTQSKAKGSWRDGPGYYTASLLRRSYGTGSTSELRALEGGDAVDRKIACANILVTQASYAYMFQAMSRAMNIWVRSQAREYLLNPFAQHMHMLKVDGVKLQLKVDRVNLHPCRSVFRKYGEKGHFCKPLATIRRDADLRVACSRAMEADLAIRG